jgi:hypothetical protein
MCERERHVSILLSLVVEREERAGERRKERRGEERRERGRVGTFLQAERKLPIFSICLNTKVDVFTLLMTAVQGGQKGEPISLSLSFSLSFVFLLSSIPNRISPLHSTILIPISVKKE